VVALNREDRPRKFVKNEWSVGFGGRIKILASTSTARRPVGVGEYDEINEKKRGLQEL